MEQLGNDMISLVFGGMTVCSCNSMASQMGRSKGFNGGFMWQQIWDGIPYSLEWACDTFVCKASTCTSGLYTGWSLACDGPEVGGHWESGYRYC